MPLNQRQSVQCLPRQQMDVVAAGCMRAPFHSAQIWWISWRVTCSPSVRWLGCASRSAMSAMAPGGTTMWALLVMLTRRRMTSCGRIRQACRPLHLHYAAPNPSIQSLQCFAALTLSAQSIMFGPPFVHAAIVLRHCSNYHADTMLECKVLREMAALEGHNVMQAIHGNRTIYNVRNGWDIARFLADAVKEDVESHLGNLKCALHPIHEMLCHGLYLSVTPFIFALVLLCSHVWYSLDCGSVFEHCAVFYWQEVAGGAAVQSRLGISYAPVSLGGASTAEL